MWNNILGTQHQRLKLTYLQNYNYFANFLRSWHANVFHLLPSMHQFSMAIY